MKTTTLFLSIIALFISACNAAEINQNLPSSTNTNTTSQPVSDPTLVTDMTITPMFIDDSEDQPPEVQFNNSVLILISIQFHILISCQVDLPKMVYQRLMIQNILQLRKPICG